MDVDDSKSSKTKKNFAGTNGNLSSSVEPIYVLKTDICKYTAMTKVRKWSFTHNYVNPVCCVTIICHQVRCMYRGHLGHFHRAISHSKWYRIVCMRYSTCTFSQAICRNMGIWDVFMLRPIGKIYLGFVLFTFSRIVTKPEFSAMPCHVTHCSRAVTHIITKQFSQVIMRNIVKTDIVMTGGFLYKWPVTWDQLYPNNDAPRYLRLFLGIRTL